MQGRGRVLGVKKGRYQRGKGATSSPELFP